MSLRDIQKRTLEKVVSLSLTEGFYLAGGTALAIRYGHRHLSLKSLSKSLTKGMSFVGVYSNSL